MKKLLIAMLILAVLVLGAGCTGSAPTSPVPNGTTIVSGTAPASQIYPATSLEIREYVDSAAEFAQENGREKALATFQNATGPFVRNDVYIYALDYSGIALALPFQPEMVGEDFVPLMDGSGKPYTEIEIRLAESGGGYILYHYPYPVGDQPERHKISYVRPVDDTYWIGGGVYTSDDILIDPELRQFVGDAKAYATANGLDEALAAFNNQSGPFIDGELSIFAIDYNGNVLSWPSHPDKIGINHFTSTDPVTGIYDLQEMLETARNGGGMVDYYSINPVTNTPELRISYVVDVDGTWMLGAARNIEPGPLVLRS